MRDAPFRLLILGGDADGNLGDRAIQQGMCLEARRVRPGIEIQVISADAQSCRERFGATAILPGPAGFLKLCRAAWRSDLILVGGGGLFQDDDSLVKMPYWSLRVLLMRMLCRHVRGFSLGVGPLDHAVSRMFARLAFRAMDAVSVRDPRAAELAQSLTSKEVRVVPDPALLLPAAPADVARKVLESNDIPHDGSKPLIGVAVRRWFPKQPRLIPHKLAHRFSREDETARGDSDLLVQLFGQALATLQNELGAYILFLPTYNLAHEADNEICVRMRATLAEDRSSILELDDPAVYKAVTGQLDALVGGRMHPTILAAAMGTPVVGLAYNQKFRGFFEMMGREHFVLDVEDFVLKSAVAELVGLTVAALGEDPERRKVDELCQRSGNMLREFLEVPSWAQSTQ